MLCGYADSLTFDSIYWFCALAGSGMLFIQFAMDLVGLGSGEELSTENFTDIGKFKWLTRQALAGFLGIFGWVALACDREFQLGQTATLALALLAGCATVLCIGLIFKLAKGLQSPGTVFRIQDAVGREALVYLRIPQGGAGKVQLSINEFTREVDAVSAEELASFTRVQIIKVVDDNTVFVTALYKEASGA